MSNGFMDFLWFSSSFAELTALDCASPATERNPRDCCRFRKAGDLQWEQSWLMK